MFGQNRIRTLYRRNKLTNDYLQNNPNSSINSFKVRLKQDGIMII